MSVRLLVTALVLCVALPAGTIARGQGGAGQEAGNRSASQALRERVLQLVRQLNDPDAGQRDAAERELIKLGPQGLPYLPQVTAQMPAEVKVRLERVLYELQKESARQALEPSRVTLRGTLPAAEALKAMVQQTGNQLSGYQDIQTPVALDLHDAPFWKALDQVLDAAALTIDPYAGEFRTLALTRRPPGYLPRSGRACYQGIFRFDVTQVQSVRHYYNPQLNYLGLRLAVAWEPRIRPITLSQPLDRVVAVDDRQQPLEIAEPGGVRTAMVESDIPEVELEIPFQLPDRSARKIASLQGTLQALLPGQVEDFVFSDLGKARNVALRKAGLTVTLLQVRRNESVYEFWLQVRFDQAGQALESHRGWIFRNKAVCRDAAGNELDHLGYHTIRQGNNEVVLAYLFQLPGGPEKYQFLYRSPVILAEIPVTYTIKDLPLP